MSAENIGIQLNLEDIENISLDPKQPDNIKVVLNKEVFEDPLTDNQINGGFDITIDIPRQIEPKEARRVYQVASQVSEAATSLL